MKRCAVFVIIFLVLCNCAYAQLFGGFIGGLADGLLRGVGFTRDQSRDIINTVTSVVGGDSYNVNRGVGFIDADKRTQANMLVNEVVRTAGELTGRTDITNALQTGVNAGFDAAKADDNNERAKIIVDGTLEVVGDVTGKTDITGVIQKGVNAGFDVSKTDNDNAKVGIITGTALDIVGDLTDGHEVTNKVKTYINNELIYQSDISKAETVEDLREAIDKKSRADNELFYDIGLELYDRMEEKKKLPNRKKPLLVAAPLGPYFAPI